MVWNVFFQDWIAFHVATRVCLPTRLLKVIFGDFGFWQLWLILLLKFGWRFLDGLKVLALLSKYLNAHLLDHMIRLYLASKNLSDSFESISITAFPLAMNSFSGSLPVSSSFIWTSVFLVCSFICVVFLFLFHYYYYCFNYHDWGLLFQASRLNSFFLFVSAL